MTAKSNNQLIAFNLIPLGGVIAGFVIALVLTMLFVQSSITGAHQERLIDQAADNARARVNQAQMKLLKQANNMATSIRLTELVANADASARALEEARLRELIPNAVRVRMIRVGEAKVDRDESPRQLMQTVAGSWVWQLQLSHHRVTLSAARCLSIWIPPRSSMKSARN